MLANQVMIKTGQEGSKKAIENRSGSSESDDAQR